MIVQISNLNATDGGVFRFDDPASGLVWSGDCHKTQAGPGNNTTMTATVKRGPEDFVGKKVQITTNLSEGSGTVQTV